MKNQLKLDRKAIFNIIHSSQRGIEKEVLGDSKYGDANEYLRVAKMFSELGDMDRVDRTVRTAQDAFLKEGIANFVNAIILSGYLNSSDIEGRIEDEEIDLILQTLDLLLDKAVDVSDSIKNLNNLTVIFSPKAEKKYGGYNPLENPHGGK